MRSRKIRMFTALAYNNQLGRALQLADGFHERTAPVQRFNLRNAHRHQFRFGMLQDHFALLLVKLAARFIHLGQLFEQGALFAKPNRAT